MKTVQDEAIIQMIRQKLDSDRRTCGQMIDVSVNGGDILLIGVCDDEEQKVTAKIIVQGTYGVRSVVNRVRVRTISQSI